MSLSHQVDEYLMERGIEASAEVIPELPCYEFDMPNGGAEARRRVAEAEDLIAESLRS